MTTEENSTTEERAPVYLTQLTIKNFKKVSFVRLNPTSWEPLVIGGANAQGKSTIMDAVLALLLGKEACPVQPIKLGKSKSEIEGYLGDEEHPNQYLVKRKFSADGSTKLTVDATDGSKLDMTAQAFLTSIAGKSKDAIAFDPLLLAKMSKDDQDAFMRKICGVDFGELNADRKKLYDERALVNKEHDRATHEAEKLAHHNDAPGRELVVTELVAELERRRQTKSTNDVQRQGLQDSRDHLADSKTILESLDRDIAAIEAQLQQMRTDRDNRAIGIASEESLLPDAEAAVSALVDPDIEAALADIADAEATNTKVRANASRLEAVQRANRIADRSEDLTERIKKIDGQKATILENANYPIDGLGFDDSGPTFASLPLNQASQAQLIQIGVAIGVALRPRLRLLLVRSGNDLDSQSRAALWELAQKHKCHVWIEVVSETGAGCSIVMSEGHIVGVEEE